MLLHEFSECSVRIVKNTRLDKLLIARRAAKIIHHRKTIAVENVPQKSINGSSALFKKVKDKPFKSRRHSTNGPDSSNSILVDKNRITFNSLIATSHSNKANMPNMNRIDSVPTSTTSAVQNNSMSGDLVAISDPVDDLGNEIIPTLNDSADVSTHNVSSDECCASSSKTANDLDSIASTEHEIMPVANENGDIPTNDTLPDHFHAFSSNVTEVLVSIAGAEDYDMNQNDDISTINAKG